MTADMVDVAFVDEWERLHTLKIARDAIPEAKAQGWMVMWTDEDVQPFNAPHFDHLDGVSDIDEQC